MTATIDPLLYGPASRPYPAVRRAPATARRTAGSHRPVVQRSTAHHSAAAHAQPGATRIRPSEAVFRRRRRMVGAVLALVAAVLAFALVSTGAFASESTSAREMAPRTVVAQPGDTLWDIARTMAPTGPIGDLVSELVRLNGARIEAGQTIRLP